VLAGLHWGSGWMGGVAPPSHVPVTPGRLPCGARRYGVTCVKDTVTQLALGGNNASGELPASITKLVHLRWVPCAEPRGAHLGLCACAGKASGVPACTPRGCARA
jgi:hypothetical protein